MVFEKLVWRHIPFICRHDAVLIVLRFFSTSSLNVSAYSVCSVVSVCMLLGNMLPSNIAASVFSMFRFFIVASNSSVHDLILFKLSND